MNQKVSYKIWVKNRYERHSIASLVQSYYLLDSGLRAMRDEIKDVVQYGCVVKKIR